LGIDSTDSLFTIVFPPKKYFIAWKNNIESLENKTKLKKNEKKRYFCGKTKLSPFRNKKSCTAKTVKCNYDMRQGFTNQPSTPLGEGVFDYKKLTHVRVGLVQLKLKKLTFFLKNIFVGPLFFHRMKKLLGWECL
jgi:hypothetical protein